MQRMREKKNQAIRPSTAVYRGSTSDTDSLETLKVTDGILSIPDGFDDSDSKYEKCFENKCLIISIIFGAIYTLWRCKRQGYLVKGEKIAKLANNDCWLQSKKKAMVSLFDELQRIYRQYPSLETCTQQWSFVAPILAKEYGKF